MLAPEEKGKPGICVDFDGVIHSYTSGWQGTDVIGDPPVEGAIAALYGYVQHFKVHIYSARSVLPEGIEAMRNYIGDHEQKYRNRRYDEGKYIPPERLEERLEFPNHKPPCLVYIDDRGFRFEGVFPTLEELKALFTTWNKKESSQLKPTQ